jgi:hypothetical protein
MPASTGTRATRLLASADAADLLIHPAGSSALILGVYVANTTTGSDHVDIEDADGTVRLTIAVGANDTEGMSTPFIMNNGINIDPDSTDATTSITIIWRPDA